MRPSSRLRFASPGVPGAGGLGSHAPMPLLPPIPLYRRLLRAHRKFLPAEMRLLGDEYIKAEFRAHKDVENPAHLVRLTLCILTPFFLQQPQFTAFLPLTRASLTPPKSSSPSRPEKKFSKWRYHVMVDSKR